jgi:hypothetical protein
VQNLSPEVVCFFFITGLLSGCGGPVHPAFLTATSPAALVFTETAAPSPAATDTAGSEESPAHTASDSGWVFLRAGLEQRRISLPIPGYPTLEEILLLRIAPEFFTFDVAYDPQGKELVAWRASTGAEVVVNGGYFRREPEGYFPDGLLVVDGRALGESYGEYAGMLAVTDRGPELRWLSTRPYDPAEKFRVALQCFPMLIKPGGQVGFPAESDDGIRARRTAVAQDRSGRILFLVASQGGFTLRGLSVYLQDVDLDLETAMNLDGGPSTGMALAEPGDIIPAQTALPIVLLVRAV